MNLKMDNYLEYAGLDSERFSLFLKRIKNSAEGKKRIDTDRIVRDLDELSKRIVNDEHRKLLMELGLSTEKAEYELREAEHMLSQSYIRGRLEKELAPFSTDTVREGRNITEIVSPLGTVFHICAGNMDALPFYSLMEGLITGNVNIIKLPGGEMLTLKLTEMLLEIDPDLSDMLYITDIPSLDIQKLKALADISDAVVIWGGDEAVKAVRSMAPVNTRIIEWGHRISFAYVTSGITDEELKDIACNICDTEGLLCTSIQGIYYDSSDMEETETFAHRFQKILSKVSKRMPGRLGSMYARGTVTQYTYHLEDPSGTEIINDKNCSVILMKDSMPRIFGPRSVFVIPLEHERIAGSLSGLRSYLSSVALYCSNEEEDGITDALIRAGACRITDAVHISGGDDGLAHDGRYSLRELTKIVTIER